jgi:hypothetical protein
MDGNFTFCFHSLITREVDQEMYGERRRYPNVLLISGSGRDTGKTTLACQLIRKICREEKVTAIKISPHFHEVDYPEALAKQHGDYAIYLERRSDRPKDSSRLLAAGAGTVYYVQARDNCLSDLWSVLYGWLDPQAPIIVESGGLHRLIRPGISISLRHADRDRRKHQSSDADIDIITSLEQLNSSIGRIIFRNGMWMLKEGHDDI